MSVVLVVVAHCDDEAQGAGGAIARHVRGGDVVYGAYFTDGVGSRYESWCDEWRREKEERRGAAKSAAAALGFEWIAGPGDFPDNAMDRLSVLDLAQWLERDLLPELVRREGEGVYGRVSRVYTNYLYDANQDHRMVRKACQPVFGRSVRGRGPVPIYEMEVPRATEHALVPFHPNVYVPLTSADMDRKDAALEAYRMELTEPPDAASMDVLLCKAIFRGSHCNAHLAEGFVCREMTL